MRSIILSAAIVAGLLVPSSASAWYGSVFRSPSGNLVCKYRAAFDSIACGRRNDERIVAMTAYGPAREGLHMDWSGQQMHVLYYGDTYRGIGSHITCGSFSNGVRCTNWRGHGFFINRTILNRW